MYRAGENIICQVYSSAVQSCNCFCFNLQSKTKLLRQLRQMYTDDTFFPVIANFPPPFPAFNVAFWLNCASMVHRERFCRKKKNQTPTLREEGERANFWVGSALLAFQLEESGFEMSLCQQVYPRL